MPGLLIQVITCSAGKLINDNSILMKTISQSLFHYEDLYTVFICMKTYDLL